MEVRLQKWGNSLGIRIPCSVLKLLELKDNDSVNLKLEDDKIIISKTEKSKVSLKKLFDKYSGPNLTKEFVWDDARGKELW